MAAPARCQPRGCGSSHTGPFSAVAELLGKRRERSPVPASRDFWARFVSPTPCIPAAGAHLLEPSCPPVSQCPPCAPALWLWSCSASGLEEMSPGIRASCCAAPWSWCLGEMGSETDSMELTGGRQGWGGRKGNEPAASSLLPVVLPSPDSASEPGGTAKLLCIDVVKLKGHLCLTFTGNGAGMTPHKLRHMLR